MQGKFKLNRDTIKYLAMFTMLLNHLSYVLFGLSEQLSAVLLRDVGYFTAPVMCYFMAEGYRYTRSKKNYAIRLAVFAALSQVPFYYVFAVKVKMKGVGMNMIFTLLLCFCMLLANEYIYDEQKKKLVWIGLLIISIASDWAVFAPGFTLFFYLAGDDRKQTKKLFHLFALGYAVGVFCSDLGTNALGTCLIDMIGSFIAVEAAGYVIMNCYNGKRALRGKVFSKWFFYGFYPLHLLVLGLFVRGSC